jgi:adenylate kinase family enzyme
MCVVHISGSPGSGESTLGARLAARDICVYDTDEFIQNVCWVTGSRFTHGKVL